MYFLKKSVCGSPSYADLCSVCHVPCLGLHSLRLLCFVECTKAVWQTKAVQFIDSVIGGERDAVGCRQV